MPHNRLPLDMDSDKYFEGVASTRAERPHAWACMS